MKMHLTAICYNERELEVYVNQLQSQGFESLSDAKKSDDGTYYQAMAKTAKAETTQIQPAAQVAVTANA